MKSVLTLATIIVFYCSSYAQARLTAALKNDDYLVFWTRGGMAMQHIHKIYCLSASMFGLDTVHSKEFIPSSASDLKLQSFDKATF